MKQLRINFFGAPGRGKSNLAAWTYSVVRLAHVNAELVQEWVKHWAYNKYKIEFFDQIYIFGKQYHIEYDLLKAGVKNIISDSPLWLSVFYAPIELKRPISQIIELYEAEYPSLNFLVLKDLDAKYEREGRYQDSIGAEMIEDKLIKFMPEVLGQNYQTIFFSEREKIQQAVLEAAIR